MPLSKLTFNPGINRDTTKYSNTGGWYDSDKVRFRNGLPEKIGGWQKFLNDQFLGVARDITRWASLNSTIYTAIATNIKVYINGGSLAGYYDVTPIRKTSSLTNPFTVTNGSTEVVVTDSGHGAIEGSYVTFSGASSVGGVPDTELNAEFEITHVIDTEQYIINVTTAASSSATGGGSVTAAYQLNIGLDTSVVGTGWGAGPYSGAPQPCFVYTLGTDPIETSTATNGSSPYDTTVLTITHVAHGLLTGDTIVLAEAASVGGVDAKFINRPFTITKIDADSYTVTAYTNATSDASGGGSSVTATCYRIASPSVTGWGEEASESSLTLQLRLWSLENYGEDLIMNPRDGGIYYWVENTPTTRAVNISSLTNAANCPQFASKILVSEIGQHLMAFGCDSFEDPGTQDKMLIRWSSDQRPEYWDESDTTENAGSLRLSNGSFIMSAEQTRQEILVWTDNSLYSIQYQGAPYIFTATLLSSGIDIIGPNSNATAVNTTFWMGSDNFYYYDGTVNRMPCTVREKVFLDLNFSQRFKVFAGVNSENNEVTWFYPSANSDTNDRYVTYNYAEKVWYYGTLARTAWADRGFSTNPIAAGLDGYLYYHEVGSDDGSTNPPSPISAYIESSPVEIEDGDKIAFVSRVIPDISFRDTGNYDPAREVAFAISPQMYPGSVAGTSDSNPVVYSYAVNGFTDQLFTRIRGRSVILRVSSDDIGVAWRVGTPRLDIRLDGRR